MRRVMLVAALFAGMVCLSAAEAQNAAAAPAAQVPGPVITMHVSRCTVRLIDKYGYLQQLEGTLDGKKVLLESDSRVTGLFSASDVGILPPGDYPVQLVEEKQVEVGVVRKYMLTLPGGKQRKYNLMGLSE